MTYPAMLPGTLYGFHGEQTNSIIPIIKARPAGTHYGALLSVENPGRNVDAKAADPIMTTVARFLHPNRTYEGGQDAGNWPVVMALNFATTAIALPFGRMNPTEAAGSDYVICGTNEWNFPGDWTGVGKVWLALMAEATRRNDEYVRKCGHPLRLGLICSSQGTPEYPQMKQLAATGIFDAGVARGDILIVHEGPWENGAVDMGYGDLIPGAPYVPAYGGSMVGRVNYWYTPEIGCKLPFIVGECYDGLRRTNTPAERMARLRWMDRVYRHNPYYRGLCAFELTDDPAAKWYPWEFTQTFRSPEMVADMSAQKDEPNPIKEPNMAIDPTMKAAIEVHLAAIETILNPVAAPWWQKATPFKAAVPNKVLVFRNADGTPLVPNPRPAAITYQLDVYQVNAALGLLRVTDFTSLGNWWCAAADLSPA
jgi:hypothetical protein